MYHIETLGHRYLDLIHAWNSNIDSNKNLEYPIDFIKNAHSGVSMRDVSHSRSSTPSSFSNKKHLCFEAIIKHFNEGPNENPLKMIIQGIAWNGKSYLIHCISQEFSLHSRNRKLPLLLVAPTRVVSFNIRAKMIHSALRIPIRDFKSLHGQALSVF